MTKQARRKVQQQKKNNNQLLWGILVLCQAWIDGCRKERYATL